MKLTTAFLLDFDEILPVIMNNKLLIKDLNKKSYLLISSVNAKFTKLTIYPIEDDKVIKIIFSGIKLNPYHISQITNIFSKSNLEIIHTSGLVLVKDVYICEIYILDLKNELNLLEQQIFSKKEDFELDSIEKLIINKKKK